MVAVARPQVLSGDYNAREAYDAVPQLHARGEGFIQNIGPADGPLVHGYECMYSAEVSSFVASTFGYFMLC